MFAFITTTGTAGGLVKIAIFIELTDFQKNVIFIQSTDFGVCFLYRTSPPQPCNPPIPKPYTSGGRMWQRCGRTPRRRGAVQGLLEIKGTQRP